MTSLMCDVGHCWPQFHSLARCGFPTQQHRPFGAGLPQLANGAPDKRRDPNQVQVHERIRSLQTRRSVIRAQRWPGLSSEAEGGAGEVIQAKTKGISGHTRPTRNTLCSTFRASGHIRRAFACSGRALCCARVTSGTTLIGPFFSMPWTGNQNDRASAPCPHCRD